jgi:hypothetical protein
MRLNAAPLGICAVFLVAVVMAVPQQGPFFARNAGFRVSLAKTWFVHASAHHPVRNLVFESHQALE